MAKKKITLEGLAALITDLRVRVDKGFAASDKKTTSLDTRTERGFSALADDIADIKRDMATKDQIMALHTQVNGIETDIRTMQGYKLVTRVADLEEEVFGKPRA
jgi:hypothetical protein